MSHQAERVRLVGVEVARGVAACLVVFYHAARHIAKDTGGLPFGPISQFGHAGVDFFFVLSGFIILFVHADDIGRPSRFAHYVLRRVTRIYPVYWVMLAVTLAIAAYSAHQNLPSATKMLGDVFLLPNGATIIGVAWTLQLEMLFYAIFLFMILHRTVGVSMLLGWAGWTLLGYVGQLPSGLGTAAETLASPYCLQFFFGMGAATWLRRNRVPLPGLCLTLGTGAFLIAGLSENAALLDGYANPARFAYGLPAMLALIGIVGLEREGRLRLPRPIVAIGNASYAIYLMHLLIIGAVWKILVLAGLIPLLPNEAIYLILVFAGIVGGVLGSQFVEYPLMRWTRRLLHGGTGAPRTVSPATDKQ